MIQPFVKFPSLTIAVIAQVYKDVWKSYEEKPLLCISMLPAISFCNVALVIINLMRIQMEEANDHFFIGSSQVA